MNPVTKKTNRKGRKEKKKYGRKEGMGREETKKNSTNVHNLALEIKILLKEYIQQKDEDPLIGSVCL